ncbi:uncharacterized protein [Atheta coriaria]|uniref:uncharacterized protein n=1 Tax=Dalotia coriaria TaxID=877792 RepID=UPI0031F35C71
MFFKAFCVFALICITSWGTNAVDKCDEADRFFNCTKDGSFDWGGLTYKCPTDKVCNSQYVLTKDDGPAATTKCEPCLVPSVACSNLNFNCVATNTSKFELNGIEFECPDGAKCNQNFEHGCFPCYREKCPSTWRCPGPADEDVETDSFIGKCSGGSVCNKDSDFPCYCVNKSGKRSGRQLLRIIETF